MPDDKRNRLLGTLNMYHKPGAVLIFIDSRHWLNAHKKLRHCLYSRQRSHKNES